MTLRQETLRAHFRGGLEGLWPYVEADCLDNLTGGMISEESPSC